MSRTSSSRSPRDGNGRPNRATAGGGQRITRDQQNCARWFDNLDRRDVRPAGRPSHGEIRRLWKELEALRRLVDGEQIP
jgi:hypothetical protein